MNTRLKTILAVGMLAGFAMPASAVPLLKIVPSVGWELESTLPSGIPEASYHNSVLTVNVDGYYNANLKAMANIDLYYTFLAAETTSPIGVLTGVGPVLHTDYNTPGNWKYGGDAETGDLIDFAIHVLGIGGQSVANGANNPHVPDPLANFWLGYADAEQTKVFVAFDAGDDAPGQFPDQDDIVFMISAVPSMVSEPAMLSLLGAGLLLTGVGVRTRRRELTGTA